VTKPVTHVSETTRLASPRARVSIPFGSIEPLFASLDVVAIVGAGGLAGLLYQLILDGSVADPRLGAGLGLVASLAYVLAAHCLGLYRLNALLEGEQEAGRVWTGWGLAILVLTVILFLFKASAGASRGSVVCLFVLGGLLLVLARRLGKNRLRSALVGGAIRGRRAVLLGTQHELARLARGDLLVRFGLEETGRVVLPRGDGTRLCAEVLQSPIDALIDRIRILAAEEIILALPWSHPQDIELLLGRLRVVPLPVRLLPDRAVSTVLRRQTAISQRLYMVELQRTPLNAVERLTKRMLDVAVAATGLLLLLPVLLVAAAAIMLETDGPVIFRQRRHGFNGKSFVIYKLRTMRVMEDGAAVVQARQGDPRVTRVGRFLRETSIDELPQLWNVLQGHMSIVGPRPHALVHDHEYGSTIANYAFRHHVKPGITGWAQVRGFRGGTPRLELMQQRIALDLWYIDNWSLRLDLYIMVRTFFEVIRRRNAY